MDRRLRTCARRAGVVVVPVLLACLALLPSLGRWQRLSYHEAIVAEAARGMLASGDWLVPRIGSVPWLEKPPAPAWLVAGLGMLRGGVDAMAARLPSALAGIVLVAALASWASGRHGPRVGLLSGCCLATSTWLVTRGRLADPDVLLACLVGGALLTADAARRRRAGKGRSWYGAASGLLFGLTFLVKGPGFGAGLVTLSLLALSAWDRSWAWLRRPAIVAGALGCAAAGMAWYVAVGLRHPDAWSLWFAHLAGRFVREVGVLPEARFAVEPWWSFATSPFVAALPWTPLAILGAARSWRRARLGSAGDRLLWVWAVVPALLVAMAPARSGHYLIPMLAPWSVWSALGMQRLARRRGLALVRRPRPLRVALFAGVAIAWGLGFALVGPHLAGIGKGGEWAWYEAVGRRLGSREGLLLVYDGPDRDDRWDRAPYPTPWGPVPTDLPARLFHLHRTARWVMGVEGLGSGEARSVDWVIARERDRRAIEAASGVSFIIEDRSPAYRPDRTFVLLRRSSGGAGVEQVARSWGRRDGDVEAVGRPGADRGDPGGSRTR